MPEADFPLISHVFVLMLENHSFDNLLGFSGISGTDAETGRHTAINGLTGTESNVLSGITYRVSKPAPFAMPVDPGHEFNDTLLQLTDSAGPYDVKKGYPHINNGGFVNDYVNTLTPTEGHAKGNYGDIMKGFAPEQLPVLNALAREFALCDHWFSSMPGPTWPNRFFLHAGSSGGLDHSPTTGEILEWENLGGMNFQHGTVFDQLRTKFDNPYRLYRGDRFLTDEFPNVAALKGITALNCHPISDFAKDIQTTYDWPYTFIEPSYGDILNNTFKGGTSQHPLDDATGGELLIKQVYETIRNSPLWEKSLLIITWDEHGGFYDHAAPPAAVAPADRNVNASMNQSGFDFRQYGVRVPGVVVSSLIPRNTIDHRLYDHTSVLRTLQDLFSIVPMTERDRQANSLLPLLLQLRSPRTDCPTSLPSPAVSGLPRFEPQLAADPGPIPADHASLPGFLHAALKTDLAISPHAEHPSIMAEFGQIHTQKDAEAYMQKVKTKMQSHTE